MSTTTTSSQAATTSPLKRLIIRHPLIAFFVIAFAGSWVATLPLVLAQNGLGLLPYTIPEIGLVPLAEWFAIPASILGPTLAAFTVTAITTGKAGVRQLLRRYVLWRVGVRWYLLVLVGVAKRPSPLTVNREEVRVELDSLFRGDLPCCRSLLTRNVCFRGLGCRLRLQHPELGGAG